MVSQGRLLGWPFFVLHMQKGGIAMLILTRKIGEKLVIGDEVIISVLGVKGSQVRIGIVAPIEIQVHREEIYQRIVKERANGSERAGNL